MRAIDKALDAMAEEVASGREGAHGDELFHQAVTTAAHSAVLAQLMRFIAGMVLETRLESLGQPGRPEQSLASHRKIAEPSGPRIPRLPPRRCWSTSTLFPTWPC